MQCSKNSKGSKSTYNWMSHVISIEVSYHIYACQWRVINVNANFCAYNVWIKFWGLDKGLLCMYVCMSNPFLVCCKGCVTMTSEHRPLSAI